MAVFVALAEGVGKGAGRWTLLCKLSLELQNIETGAAEIGDRTTPGIDIARKPPLGTEDAVSVIVKRGG